MAAPTQRRPTEAVTVSSLRAQLAEATEKVDESLAAYDAHKLNLWRRAGGDPGRFYILKRDDLDLAELGSQATFRTATATRLAATLQCELLSLLLAKGMTTPA